MYDSPDDATEENSLKDMRGQNPALGEPTTTLHVSLASPELGRDTCSRASKATLKPSQVQTTTVTDIQLQVQPAPKCLPFMTSCFAICLNHRPKAHEMPLKNSS